MTCLFSRSVEAFQTPLNAVIQNENSAPILCGMYPMSRLAPDFGGLNSGCAINERRLPRLELPLAKFRRLTAPRPERPFRSRAGYDYSGLATGRRSGQLAVWQLSDRLTGRNDRSCRSACPDAGCLGALEQAVQFRQVPTPSRNLAMPAERPLSGSVLLHNTAVCGDRLYLCRSTKRLPSSLLCIKRNVAERRWN